MDFGCGSKPYEQLFTNAQKYIGVDISSSGHNHKDSKIDVFYDGHALPFKDNYFDCIFSSEVFEHVQYLNDVLPELKRVLKPGGIMMITCPFLWPEHEVPFDFRRFSSFGIKQFLQDNGFQIITHEKLTLSSEIIFQLAIENIRQGKLYKQWKPLRVITQLFIFLPLTLLGLFVRVFSSNNSALYGSNLVLCSKPLHNKDIGKENND